MESVAMEVVRVCVCSAEATYEQMLIFSDASVSIGTDVSWIDSDWTAVPSDRE